MSPMQILITAILVVGVILGLMMLAYFIKLRRTLHGAGSFICSYRPHMSSGWTQGWAVYTKDSLDWYPILSLSQRPKKSWPRRDIEIVQHVAIKSKDNMDYIQVTVRTKEYRCQLFMEAADYSGLVSWIEAAPPIPIAW